MPDERVIRQADLDANPGLVTRGIKLGQLVAIPIDESIPASDIQPGDVDLFLDPDDEGS